MDGGGLLDAVSVPPVLPERADCRRLVGRDFGDGVERAGGHAGPGLPRTGRWIELLTPATLQFLAYMLLAVLCWNAFRLCGLGINSAPAMGLAVTTLFAVTDELHQIFTPGPGCPASRIFW